MGSAGAACGMGEQRGRNSFFELILDVDETPRRYLAGQPILFFPFIVGIEEKQVTFAFLLFWETFTFSLFGLRKKINTEGDVPPSMSGSCAVCVDRVLYLFGGHHSRGNTNKVSVSKDCGLRAQLNMGCLGGPVGFYSFSDNLQFLRLAHTYSCPG